MSSTVSYNQDDSATVCAVGGYCSGVAVGTAKIIEAEYLGTTTLTTSTFSIAGSVTRVGLNFECPVPEGFVWNAGPYTCMNNVTTANANLTWSSLYFCRVSSSCVSVATIGSKSIGIPLDTTGVKSGSIDAGVQYASAGDKIMAVLTINNSAASTQSAAIDHSQFIYAPVIPGPSKRSPV